MIFQDTKEVSKTKGKKRIFLQPHQIVFELETLNMSLCSFWKPILENVFIETNQTSHIFWLLFCFPRRKSTNFFTIVLALSQAFVVLQTRQEASLGLHFVSLFFFGFLLNKWSKSSQLQLRKSLLYVPHPFLLQSSFF